MRRALVLAVLVGVSCGALFIGGEVRAATAWTRVWNGPANLNDLGWAGAPRPGGGVYVAGTTTSADTGPDLLIQRYSASGKLVWSRRHGASAKSDDNGTGVAVAKDGGACVSGVTASAAGGMSALLLKYSPTGAQLWRRTFKDAAGLGSAGSGVAVAPDGSIYLAGYSPLASGGSRMFVRAYTSGGTRRWTRFHGDATLPAAAFGVSAAANGDVIVTGFQAPAGQPYRVLLRRYSSKGGLRWSRTYTGNAALKHVGTAVAPAPDGSLFVTGFVNVPKNDDNLLLLKCSATGVPLWKLTYDAPLHEQDRGNAVGVGPDGTIWVAGMTMVAGQKSNVLLRRYSPAGVLKGTAGYNGPSSGNDAAFGLAVGKDGAVYAVGGTEVPGQAINLLVRRFR